ncbi:hypothetical protein LCGC14_0786500 [marine sediment metagenome]|uniref:Uncharacterized protein n=1 Tax=marine sediment metagenome TaxID=412755 RepID=A0A0F9SDS9_9ZZZZ|nr:MAG: hypothetical protein Lokiarch_52260 [Candidatus Lokiarchaeum sp. GC14_75]
MESFKSVLIEDVNIYKNGLEREDYSFCNIIGNRLITNAVFLDSKEFNLIGAILKEVLNFFAIIEEPKNLKKELDNLIDTFINTKELSVNSIMEFYLNFYSNIRNEINPEFEKYKDNKEYSLYSTKVCLDFLKAELDKQIIPYSRDLIYFGVSNELNRIYRNFGCNKHQLILKIVLLFSGRLYDYYRFLIMSKEPKYESWEENYLVLKEKIKKNISEFDIDAEYLGKTRDLLFELCKEWRFMYIRLLDITPQVKREKTSIPPKIQEELKGMVSKITDSEMKGD